MVSRSKTGRYFMNRFPNYKEISGEFSFPVEQKLKSDTESLIETITSSVAVNARSCDGGLYVGLAGVAYACVYVGAKFEHVRKHSLIMAQKYLDVAIQYEAQCQRPDMKPALLLGTAGVAATACLLHHCLGQNDQALKFVKRYAEFSALCSKGDYLGCGSDEMLVGRAGYLYGAHILSKKMKVQVLPQATIHSICQAMIDSGRHYARSHHSASPLMYAYYQTEYLGAAHGLSGILQSLLCFPDFVKSDPTIEKDVKGSVDFLLSCQDFDGNIAPAVDELNHKRPAEHELYHWCHGAPGVIYLFAKAYLTWKDDKYLNACIKCAEITWTKGLLRKGPGICHGVAGNGYVFLLMYRLTNDRKYLYQACKFAEFLNCEEFQREAKTPDCPYSLFEGLAGTACFLTDLLHPESAEFPWFDVF